MQIRKTLNYQHADSGKAVRVEILLTELGDHWRAEIQQSDSNLIAPMFYGQTAEQAERQIRKIFDRDHDFVSESIDSSF